MANVPASLLHGTVMPQPNEPIHAPQRVDHGPRGQWRSYFRCKECEVQRGSLII
jgi:hypothetical protein